MRADPIVIGGAGLAGSACAIRLAQCGHAVILLDKCAFPRRKLCGGFLGPDALPCLQELGVLDIVQAQAHGPVENIRLHNALGQSLRVRTRWLRRDFPYALAIPRHALDDILVRHARHAGVHVLEKKEVMACHHLDDGPDSLFGIELENHDGNRDANPLLARCFVDASGRSSRLSTFQSSMSRPKKAESKSAQKVGLQCHIAVRNPDTVPDLHMFLFPGGYGGFQPVSNEQANVCLWIRPESAKARQQGFQALLEATLYRNPAARLLLDRAEPVETIAAISSHNPGQSPSPPQSSFLRVGDALKPVEPFSGFGMAHALKTGIMAAHCIHAGLRNGHSYAQIQTDYHHAYRRRFGLHLRWMRTLHPLLESDLVQEKLWPRLPPFLPLLASLYR